VKQNVGLNSPEEEPQSNTLLQHLDEASTLSRTQRVYGFATCIGLAMVFGLLVRTLPPCSHEVAGQHLRCRSAATFTAWVPCCWDNICPPGRGKNTVDEKAKPGLMACKDTPPLVEDCGCIQIICHFAGVRLLPQPYQICHPLHLLQHQCHSQVKQHRVAEARQNILHD